MKPPPNFPITTLLTLLLASAGCIVGPHYNGFSRRTASVQEQPP